jgi:hypothetical protein
MKTTCCLTNITGIQRLVVAIGLAGDRGIG